MQKHGLVAVFIWKLNTVKEVRVDIKLMGLCGE